MNTPLEPLLSRLPLRASALSALMLFTLLASCTPTLPEGSAPDPGTYLRKIDMREMGQRRSYLLHVPAGYDSARPLPLVVALHGAFMTAREMEELSGFSTLADREGFLAAYPEGVGIIGFLQHWNAGFCCGKALRDGWDDLGFLRAVLQDVRARLAVDPKRVYVVGTSNGGMMAYHFAARNPELVAAVAGVAASMGATTAWDGVFRRVAPPALPVPLLAFHGSADVNVPLAGGTGSVHEDYDYLPVQEGLRAWAEANGCTGGPETLATERGSVSRLVWSGCRGNARVELLRIENFGHLWPNAEAAGEHSELAGFDAAEIIWRFFSGYERDHAGSAEALGPSIGKAGQAEKAETAAPAP